MDRQSASTTSLYKSGLSPSHPENDNGRTRQKWQLTGNRERGRNDRFEGAKLEVGRILAIARSEAFNPITSAALQLLVFTCQRITPIAGAGRSEFRRIEVDGEGLWMMPAPHRKTALKRGDLSDHVVPLPRPAWDAIKGQLMNNTNYAFPAARPRRAGDEPGAMASSNLSHALRYMPGVQATPHDLRRAFGTHGAREFKWGIAGTKQILDHNEGVASGDVTAESYALDDGTDEKWPIMRSWCDWCEEWALKAVEDDRRLEDGECVKAQVQGKRQAHPVW